MRRPVVGRLMWTLLVSQYLLTKTDRTLTSNNEKLLSHMHWTADLKSSRGAASENANISQLRRTFCTTSPACSLVKYPREPMSECSGENSQRVSGCDDVDSSTRLMWNTNISGLKRGAIYLEDAGKDVNLERQRHSRAFHRRADAMCCKQKQNAISCRIYNSCPVSCLCSPDATWILQTFSRIFQHVWSTEPPAAFYICKTISCVKSLHPIFQTFSGLHVWCRICSRCPQLFFK